MRSIRFTVLLLAAAAGCLPVPLPGELPQPGVYPGDGPSPLQPVQPLRDDGWSTASGAAATLDLPGSLSAVIAAVPPTGSPVVVRTFAWPAPLQVVAFDAEGVRLQGAPVPVSRFSGEIRCLGVPAATPVGLSARITGAARSARVEARIETPPAVPCDISRAGRRRLEAVATDVWMWGHALATRGAVLPSDQ